MNNRIYEAMTAQGLTAYELAKKAHIDKGALSRYLSGKVQPKNKCFIFFTLFLQFDRQAAVRCCYSVANKKKGDGLNMGKRKEENKTHILAATHIRRKKKYAIRLS